MRIFRSDSSTSTSLTPSLRFSLQDGVWFAAMLGFGESYISAFAVHLGASALQIALLATVPALIGSFTQTAGVWLMEHVRSRRRLIVLGVSLQAFSWLVIASLPHVIGVANQTAWFLLAAACFYLASGSVTAPIWSSLMGDLVPASRRGLFFGHRTQLVGLATFMSLIAASQILDFFRTRHVEVWGFTVIFVLAGGSRALCAHYLARHEDPPYQVQAHERFSFWDFIRRSPRSNFAKFSFFVASMGLAVNIAGPFFALYFLRDLNFSYFTYTALVASQVASQFLTLRHWGRISDVYGNKKILNICAWGVAIIPFFYFVSSNPWYLALVHFYSGFVWAGMNLAVGNFLYDAVSPPKRARCTAYQSILTGTFVCVGALLGSLLQDWNGLATVAALPSNSHLFGIFLVSGLCRVAVTVVFLQLFREVRDVEPVTHSRLIFRVIQLRPSSGASFFPVVEEDPQSGQEASEPRTK